MTSRSTKSKLNPMSNVTANGQKYLHQSEARYGRNAAEHEQKVCPLNMSSIQSAVYLNMHGNCGNLVGSNQILIRSEDAHNELAFQI